MRPASLIHYCHIRNVAAADNPAATDTPATQNISHPPWQTALWRPRITGDYWKGPFYRLEAEGFECVLADARQVKNLPGRPKTDKLDAVWLAKVAERGMCRPSLVHPRPIRELPDLTRYRRSLIRERTAEKQRVEKLLEDAQLTELAA